MQISADEIEKAIDKDGAWNLILAIGMVLDEKAELITNTDRRDKTNNKARAREYARYGTRLNMLAREMEKEDI